MLDETLLSRLRKSDDVVLPATIIHEKNGHLLNQNNQ